MKSTDYIEKIEMNAKSKGIYSIDLCPISNTIRFTAKYAGCMYAYVVGDFNGWEKSDDYKLTWQIDTNDKELKMIKEVKFPNKLPPGKYRYKYILIDTDGNEIWVDSYGNEKNSFSFTWETVKDILKIYSSNNIIAYKHPVELLGVCTGLYGRISLTEMEWEIKNPLPGIEIKNDYLIIDDTVPDGYEIIIKGSSCEEELSTTKTIKVQNNNFNGTLVHFYLEDNNYQGNDYICNCWSFG